MKGLLKPKELRHLVFGNPSIQLGDKTISIREVSKAIYENKEILKTLSENDYKKIINQADNAKADYANYGCYGKSNDETFYAIEFYKFEAEDVDDYLFVVIAKPFTCEFLGGETADNIIIDYNGEIESDCFFGSYVNFVSKNEIVINGKNIRLIKDIPMNTSPEEFCALMKSEKLK